MVSMVSRCEESRQNVREIGTRFEERRLRRRVLARAGLGPGSDCEALMCCRNATDRRWPNRANYQ